MKSMQESSMGPHRRSKSASPTEEKQQQQQKPARKLLRCVVSFIFCVLAYSEHKARSGGMGTRHFFENCPFDL